MPPPLTPSTPYATLLAAGEPLASVSIQNLSTLTSFSPDAWNRPNKPQPLLISASIWFSSPFPSTSDADALGADTVHYGSLSKALLSILSAHIDVRSPPHPDKAWLGWLVDALLFPRLTGRGLDGTTTATEGGEGRLLDLDRIRYLSVTLRLPKASLLGTGVSYTLAVAPQGGVYASSLTVHELRVPTLVGVNANERLARQVVVATVTVERMEARAGGGDFYTRLEAVVVKTMEESSFETLEALGACIADRVLTAFHPSNQEGPDVVDGSGWQIHVRMEKPTAVPLADCPIVEIRASAPAT